MSIRLLPVIGVCFGLIGCSTIQDDVKNDRPSVINGCIKKVEFSSQKFKAEASAYMGITRERLPQIFCDRMADAVASGKIDQSDINGLIATGKLTAKFRFLKG